MNGKLTANGATAGFLLAIVTAVYQKLQTGLDYQVAELAGIVIVLVGVLAFQWLILHSMPEDAADRFAQRIQTVLLGTVFMATAYGLLCWLNLALIDAAYLPERFAQYREEILENMRRGISDEAARAFIANNEAFMLDPFKQAMLSAGTVLGVGGMSGALLVAFSRKRV